MPARSQSQRAYLNMRFGHDWVKEHHFDNKGKLPDHVEKEIPPSAHYRRATQPGIRCGTCSYFNEGKCTMYDNTPVARGYTCDNWDAADTEPDPLWSVEIPSWPFSSAMTTLAQEIEPMLKADIRAAGIAVRARDTGRVLMLQRAHSPKDSASGCWEFPGGCLNDGEHPYTGAKREWQEEMGTRLPKGDHVGSWQSGIYQGFIHEVPSEDSVKLNLDPEDRKVKDPDGDNAEVSAWFHPHQLKRMSSLRNELRDSRPWNRVAKEEWKSIVLAKLEEDEEETEKDGDAPADGDMPPEDPSKDFGGMPDAQTLSAVGPTISAVHVPKPLKNISVAYAGKKRKLKVTKADKQRQLIYGVVLEPNVMDSQEDFMLPDHVEKAAHTYLKKVARGNSSVSKLQHRRAGFFKSRASLVPVESYIAPCDFSYDGKETVRKGTWVMVLHAEDENVWQDVMDGKYTGLSIGGTGVRHDMHAVPDGY